MPAYIKFSIIFYSFILGNIIIPELLYLLEWVPIKVFHFKTIVKIIGVYDKM